MTEHPLRGHGVQRDALNVPFHPPEPPLRLLWAQLQFAARHYLLAALPVPLTVEQAFSHAVQCHQAGRLAEAEGLYRQILAVHPAHADALHLLGLIALQMGRPDAAVDLIRRALALQPAAPAFYNHLGLAWRALHRPDAALAAFREGLALQPDAAEMRNNFGTALRDSGQLAAAIAEYRRAAELKPRFFEALSNLGNALVQAGETDAALAALRQAAEWLPDNAAIQGNLGIALQARGDLAAAARAFQQATTLDPHSAVAHCNLGAVLRHLGRLDEAAAALSRALALRPDSAEAQHNYGLVLRDLGHLDEAIACFHRALAIQPHYAAAHNSLGTAWKDCGCLDAALAEYRLAVAGDPRDASAHSNLILAALYHPAWDEAALRAECAAWARRHASPNVPLDVPPNVPLDASPDAPLGAPWSNDRDPERPLKIGYVSADFRDHVVGRNVLPLLERHRRDRFEVVCYSCVVRPDAITARFRRAAAHWREVAGLSDVAFAKIIRDDRIDILVDLALHTAGNRLPLFARQPAPVQVSFAGYPGTTGVDAIEYHFSDPYLEGADLPSAARSRPPEPSAERVLLLPSFWCYDPLDLDLPVNDLPAWCAGRVTLGCLHNFCKINDQVLRLWSRVLRQLPEAHLLLSCEPGSHRRRTLDFLAREGVAEGRVEFIRPSPRPEYLAQYHRLDLVLDTFPYNGHTTSLDALWMGVPVVSLAGDRLVSRAGWSQLSNLGLADLVAHSPDDFVTIVERLVGDLPRLAALRSTLRRRMENSVLMDAARFAANIENAWRQIWRRCVSGADRGNP